MTTSTGTAAAQPIAATNRLPLLSLFAANAISMVGNVCATIAIPWFVLQTTGSATQTGITGFFTILPVVLAGLLGGTLIDRLGYKRTSIISDLASGVTVTLIPLLHFTVGLQFWQLMVLVFLGALLDAPGSTARSALVPDLAALAGMPIERAASANQVVERSSRMVGAPLAGFLIAVLGTANVLWLDAASFFISAAMVALLITAAHAKPTEAAAHGKYADQLLDGLRFVRRDHLILAVMVTVMITNFLDAAFGAVVLPVYVKQVFGNALDLGLIIAASGCGAVVGALVFSAVGHRLPRHLTFVAMFVLVGLRFWIFALYLPLPLILIATIVSGVGAGPLNPIIDAVAYERIPSDMRGRVFGSATAGAWVAMPLGMLLGGILTEQFGVQPLLISIGLAYLVTTLSMAFIPALRQMNRSTDTLAGRTLNADS
jgi:MFS family permease